MKAVQILIAIVLAAIAYLLLRFIIKRLWLFSSLKKFAKKHNFTCTIPLAVLLPINSSNRYVQITTTKSVYNIKLFGLLRKHCEIHFWNTQEYSVAWYFMRTEFTGTTPICLSATHRRSLGKPDWLTADGVPILLISPAQAPVRLTKTDVNHFTRLRAGEKICDAIFADLDYLFRYIEKQEH